MLRSTRCYAKLLHPEKPRKLRRREYERLVELGVFEDERIELLHGTLVAMSPLDPEHASPVDRLGELFVRASSDRARVRIQQPLVAVDESEPEPDVAIVPLGDCRKTHPATAHLVVEVAFTSLRKDRLIKAPLYAASEVREYWIVDIEAAAVEVHRSPSGGAYSEVSTHLPGEVLHPEAFPDVAIPIAAIFA